MKKITLLILLTMIFAFSRTKYPAQSGREFQIVRHNINNIEMCVSNFGKFGQDETGGNSGLWWPKYTLQNYIYGAGSWFGIIDPVVGDTMVTIGYGPSGGQSEYAPGMAGWIVSDPDAIIFIDPTTWPSTVPSRLEDVFPANAEKKSHQDSWCVYNDLDIQYHMPGDTRPIGLEVYQTVYAWNLSTTADIIFVKYELKNVSGSVLNDCWFGVCTDNDIGNEAGTAANDICSGIVGQYYDIDGTDEWIDDLGYQWQDEEEGGWANFPGVIGFDYLQSPYDLVENADKDGDTIPDQFEQDSAYYVNNWPPYKWDVDNDGTPDWRDPSQNPQIGMTSFMRFTLDLEPGSDGERYVCMEGYNYKTMVYVQYDTVIPAASDQRFVQCSGPFELEIDEIVTVLVGVMCAARTGPDDPPDSAIVRVDKTAQYIFDMNWLLPGPPPAPSLNCVPGDVEITLIWNNIPETYPDPYYKVVSDPSNPDLYDPYYIELDFQGYGVWKSLNGQDWALLRRFDLYDNVVFADTAQPESIRIYADNSGINHVFVDTDVRNGFTYYYAITSFDYNWVKETYDSVFVIDSVWYAPDSEWIYVYDDTTVTGPRAIWFEGGKVGVSAMPRRDPADYVPGGIDIEVLNGNPAIADNNIETMIAYPAQMTDELFYLDFGPIVYDDGDPLYSAVLTDEDGDNLGDVSVTLAAGDLMFSEFGTRNGISISAILQRDSIPTGSIFDRIETSNNYFVSIDSTISIDSTVTPWDTTWIEDSLFIEDYLVPTTMPTNWSYRGNDYEVHWIKAPGSNEVNSVVVIDSQARATIPFKAYMENPATDSLADGWCFRSATQSTETLVYGNPGTGTKFLYICGGKFSIARGWLDVEPRPSENDVWTVFASHDYLPAPANARLQITPNPAAYGTEPIELRVKVVPNPYLVYNEWQPTLYSKRLKFINLPSDCIIRIFNLNGELVRTIRHQHTLEPGIGEQRVIWSAGGDEWWDLLSDNRQLVASGVYIFHVQSDVGEQVGKFVIIR